jgi:glucose-1-phosphate thymidylyltransferase
LILAAGYATRLYPLTENFPKPLLMIGTKTIIDWLIDDINTSKIVDEYIVVTNHKFAPYFLDWAKHSKENITVVDDGTTTNETRLGAVKDMLFAIETLQIEDDVMVIAGDNVLDFSLTKFIAYAQEKNTSCIMRYFEPDKSKLLKCGVVTVDNSDKILHMTEKSDTPATHWCCPPFYYYRQSDIKLIRCALKDGCPADAPGSFFAWLSKKFLHTQWKSNDSKQKRKCERRRRKIDSTIDFFHSLLYNKVNLRKVLFIWKTNLFSAI